MTHDELTAHLRYPKHAYSAASSGTMLDAADRLDRYRNALLEAKRQMDEMACVLWDSPGSGKGQLGTGFIDEVLK